MLAHNTQAEIGPLVIIEPATILGSKCTSLNGTIILTTIEPPTVGFRIESTVRSVVAENPSAAACIIGTSDHNTVISLGLE